MTWREFNKEIHGYYTRPTEDEINDYVEISDAEKICKNPDLSIIVLTYNHEKWIEKCIESLVCQETHYSFEIVLSEDCSTDETLGICRKLQKKYPSYIRLLAANSNHPGNSWRSWRVARGRYISWCEGDDHWLTIDKIEKQVSYMENHLDCEMTASRYRVVDSQHKLLYEAPNIGVAGRLHRLSRDGYLFCHLSTWCVRRSLFEKIGFLANQIRACADTILLTIAEGLSEIYIMPDVFSEYHLSGTGVWTSLSQDMQRMKAVRGTINRIRFLPEPMKTYGRWNLFLDYYGIGKATFKERRYSWSINCLMRAALLLLLHPSILKYYFISKRKSV